MILIDGDIIAYRCAFSTKDKLPKDACDAVDELLTYILEEASFITGAQEYRLFLTGKGNFRTEIAKTAVYKGNRKGTEKPLHLECIRCHMIDHWDAEVSSGEEADDLIAKSATEFGPKVVIASADKDMLQLSASHFNFNKNTWDHVDAWRGLHFFYKQILMGDTADNIVGLYRVGPVKADKMLEGCKTEDQLYDRVVEAYEGDESRVIENARLLWLRRYEDELWQPPHMR